MTTHVIHSSILIEACRSGRFEQLASSANSYDERGGFLLLRFLETSPFTSQHVKILPRLITVLKIDVNQAHARTGKTPLHYAAIFGPLAAVKILLENNAAVDARDKDEYTPLMCSAFIAGNSKVIGCLIDAKASIDAVSHETKKTALHFAVKADQVENARVLLMRGANRKIQDINGNSSLDLAKSVEMSKIFTKSVEELRFDVEHQITQRIPILLSKANPLYESIMYGDLSEARFLMKHPQFTDDQLEEGFRFAFSGLPLNHDFLFELFKDKLQLIQMVYFFINEKSDEMEITETKIQQDKLLKHLQIQYEYLMSGSLTEISAF
ncbi:MAG: ankyrin repeat domain-containing protein [Rhabdochlamydiaceae bacterium]|jgi:hypothetical protein